MSQAPTAGCSSVAWAETPGAAASVASSRVARTMAVDARRRMGLTPLLSPHGRRPEALSFEGSAHLDGGRDHRESDMIRPRVNLVGRSDRTKDDPDRAGGRGWPPSPRSLPDAQAFGA